MENVSIKILDPKVKPLLRDLENLKLIELEEEGQLVRPKRRFGSMKGLVISIAEDFDAPLDDFEDGI